MRWYSSLHSTVALRTEGRHVLLSFVLCMRLAWLRFGEPGWALLLPDMHIQHAHVHAHVHVLKKSHELSTRDFTVQKLRS